MKKRKRKKKGKKSQCLQVMGLMELDSFIQKNKYRSCLSLCTKLSFKWIKGLKVKPDA